MFYKIFEKLSSKTMKTATSVCTIQCRIAINVGLVEFLWLYGMPALLLDIFYSTNGKDTGKLKSFL